MAGSSRGSRLPVLLKGISDDAELARISARIGIKPAAT
jgi:hypothetical protein